MTREELIAEVLQLRSRQSRFQILDGASTLSKEKEQAAISEEVYSRVDASQEEWERVESPETFTLDAREHLDHVMLRRFLSDLARLSIRHEVILDKMQGDDLVRLIPLTDWFGGYVAKRVDDGHLVMSSYGHGVAWDELTDAIVGADMHPEARAKRAAQWRDENAEAHSELDRRTGRGVLSLLKSWEPLDPDE